MAICAIYCRLSKEDIDKNGREIESESIKNQRTMLVDYATKQGWFIIEVYVDDDFSGIDAKRPAFNRLLADAESKKFDIVLCKSQSRFTRDMEMVEKYLHNRFVIWGIRFISIVDNADTSIKGNKKSRQINGLVNEWYLEDASANVKGSLKIKRSEGEYLGNYGPYGYQKDPNDRHKLVVDEEAADVVRHIFDWYLSGYGYKTICDLLAGKDIVNPTWYRFEKGMTQTKPTCLKFWYGCTVRAILVNRMYVGDMVQGVKAKLSYKDEKMVVMPEENWDVVAGTHQAIIDQVVFDQVQSRILSNPRITKSGKLHPLAGKIKCLDCGASMVKSGKAPKDYFNCNTYFAKSKYACTNHSIRVNKLYDLIKEKIKEKIALYSEIIVADYEHLNFKVDKAKSLQNDLSVIRRKVSETKAIIKEIYKDKVRGVIPEEQFMELNQEFQHEITVNQQIMRHLEKKIQALEDEKFDTLSIKKKIDQYLDFDELTSEVVGEFIELIKIGEKGKGSQVIEIDWLI